MLINMFGVCLVHDRCVVWESGRKLGKLYKPLSCAVC